MDRIFVIIGSTSALAAVAAGAFGAHALRETFGAATDLQNTFETAVRYHMYHSLGILAAAWVVSRWPGTAGQYAGWLFLAGILLFSGSLYALSLTGVRWLGAITPLGGLAFLAGWAALVLGAWRS